MNTPKYPHIHVQLTGVNGNAFAIMATVIKALKTNNIPKEEINQYQNESTNGDYNHLIRTATEWVTIS